MNRFNDALGKVWEEWEVPREPEVKWSVAVKDIHAKWWEARIARQKEIDASIAAKAEFEYLYDKPYEDKPASVSPARLRSKACRRIVPSQSIGTTS